MKLRLLGFALLLAGCQLTNGILPGSKAAPVKAPPEAAVSASPILAGEIAVSALDDSPASAAPQAAPAATSTQNTNPPAPEAAEPEVVKTAAQLSCEGRSGIWSKIGAHGAICQSSTKDAGKSCRASSDCSGYCLAKSNTCSPVSPMLGCHDILNEDGRMLTECVN